MKRIIILFGIIVLLIFVASIFTSCKDKFNRDIEKLMYTKVKVSDCLKGNEYLILRYVHPKSCTSCQLEDVYRQKRSYEKIEKQK